MPTLQSDQEIVAVIIEKIGAAPTEFTYDDDNRLIKLGLSGLALTQLPPELWQLTNLQVLYLNENQLIRLPPEIGKLSNLRELELRGNQLNELPAELWQLTTLQWINLHSNQLSQLPPEIGKLANLQRLSLTRNRLSQLPLELGWLGNLEMLALGGNPLSYISPEIWKLPKLKELMLWGTQLSTLPPEIGQLTSLQRLSLKNIQLSQLPPELWQLTSLQELSLENNQLSQLSPEIGLLTGLQELALDYNPLSQLPPELWQLTNLQKLWLGDMQLSQLPSEIGQLSNLQQLDVDHNQLSQLPSELWQLTNLQKLWLNDNQLSQLPPEIAQLTNLQLLRLFNNQLSQLPPEIGQLTNLQGLRLDSNQLSQLPPEIGLLTNLQELRLYSNQLSQLSPEIGLLIRLQELRLSNNQLSQLPPEMWQLTSLQKLWLDGNQLDEIPPEIMQLTNLQELYLGNTKLKRLPTEIGQLTGLQTLNVADIPTLQTPPPEIVARGTADILSFLRELQESSIIRYESKLLLVGEGGTGKSSLLRALRNDTFDSNLSTTHGVEVDRLQLSSPHHEIILNTWDFGGQQIYHATHQFFLTKRSLYMVVWNARLGVQQGRLDYWLETIKAHAPDAPMLLVATHIDERTPDLNYQLYKDVYPQIVGHLGVSNKNRQGIAELKAALADQASQLPLIGQPWPEKWLRAEEVLLARPEHHIDADTYTHCCSTCEVEADIAKGSLGNYLHDLGKILYFRDDYVLSNLIVLKPNWVTKAISRVLDDETTSREQGILPHSDLPRIWAVDEDGQRYEAHLFPIFLRLMERFYLSYQIEADSPGDHSTSSLIPQLLPYQPPTSLPTWPKSPPADQTQVEMVYRFDFLPPGIMSWFIVRTHRFSQNLHWREGVLLAYEGHQGRAELNPMQRELRLLVQGPLPQNFFTILMNTMDVILAGFEGLKVRREIPCNCHWQREETEPCSHFYRYEELVRRMQARRYKVECPESFNEVSVPTLLYGIHISTDQQVMEDIQQGQQEIKQSLKELEKLDVILGKLNQQSELIARNFTRQWNLEMQKMEAERPNTFFLISGENKPFDPKNWVSRDYRLYLVCQHPSCPHQMGDSYQLRKSKEWWITVGPWLNHLINFLKFAVPMGKAVGVVVEAVDILPDIKQIQTNIDLLEQITQDLPDVASYDSMKDMNEPTLTDQYQRTVGPALRALHNFLNEVDPSQLWGGLDKIVTPDGNILWLCDKHRQQYIVKPLKLDV